MTDRIDGFLIGMIVMASFVAGSFFLKFWRATRDSFFLAFAAAFLIDGTSRAVTVWLVHPSEGYPGIYLLRLVAYGLILLAILRKNYGRRH